VVDTSSANKQIALQYNSNYADTGYPDRLDPPGNFVENFAKLICVEITGYRMEYNIVCYDCLELQTRRSRRVKMQVRTVNSNSPRGSEISQGIPKFQMY
jgi:hypothetical protein